ncbi:sugar ABC transporter ATP-binding protein [Vibrio nigripulchritudo]|uniref:sugar ABC transporter ATP-binding protein n=1 Tax=Vibrio nigripulchritudo TaxID=28173 RepID=UPI00248FDB4A|nr:sugar ABC transporter ATP-binding protein [Vibrio nigripulchritudo]BDU37139.1 ABC transporter [Vibrio nigripulchritudo]BDU42851.1 ABC transporter [Vibrio nigripulchritudo]
MESATVLSVQDVWKSFPGVKALSHVSMKVDSGEVVAFIGENGAGKSTLLKILCGDYQLDKGQVSLDGSDISTATPLQSRNAGFRLVRQEPEIVPYISAAENVFIGEYPQTQDGRVDHSEIVQSTEQLLEKYGFTGMLDVHTLGHKLSPAQMHIVEILRAVKHGAKVVAFDEPTSSLTTEECTKLFRLIRTLQAEGLGVIYVSHRLHEIMEIADRIVVLKDGLVTGDVNASETNQDQIVSMMVGRELVHSFQRENASQQDVVFEVKNLSSHWHKDISFQIKAGEILGFAGLVGAGRTELAKVLFGEFPKNSGQVFVAGKEQKISSPADAIKANIGFAPENRKAEGLILVRSVLENASMAVYSALARFGILRYAKMGDTITPFINQLEIKTPSLDQEVGKLSGGNQQKVVLARWLAANPKVLILDEPTRAVDVGAKAEIYRLIDRLAQQGMAIMMISSEMPELLSMSDRIIVMHEGEISAPIPSQEATEESIVNFAISGKAVH